MSSENQNTLVLDSGLWEMKIGFAGDEAPRYLQKSIVGFPKNPAITISSGHSDMFIGNDVIPHSDVLNIKRPIDVNNECDWNVIEKIWHNLFYHEVKSKLDDFALFVVCSSYFDSKRKMKATELLFENFDFPSLYFQLSNVTGLFSLGRTTGLVLDSGYSRTTGISVFEGYPIEEKKFETYFGGNSLNQDFKVLLQNCIESQKVGFKTQSDFFKFYGFNFNDIYYEQNRINSYSIKDENMELRLPDGNLVKIGRDLLNQEIEASVSKLTEAILTSSSFCEEKYKSEFMQNFCLIGGNSLIPGIESKISKLLTSIGIKEISLPEKSEEEKKFASWIGGSIFASLDCFSSLLIKRSEYEEYN